MYDVIIGLGQTGLSCAKYLLKQGRAIAVTDSRKNPPGIEELIKLKEQFGNIPCVFGEFSHDLISNADRLIVSPGVSLKEPAIVEAIHKGIPYLGDIELFALSVDRAVPVVGITGSNGKSTVTTMLGEMARQAGKRVVVAGNIGASILDHLQDSAELYVLELSSFQLETTHSLHLAAATILNLSENHMDRYESLDEYARAKQRIYKRADKIIFNRDDAYTFPGHGKKAVSFGKDIENNDYGLIHEQNETWIVKGQEKFIAESEMKLKGGHNLLNAMAALALGEAVGLPISAMQAALRQFSGLRHRCQFVLEREGVAWYNDSKGSTIVATSAAIDTLADKDKNIVLIAGGQGKGQDFSALTPILEKHVKHVLLIGADAANIAKHCGNVPYTFCKDLQEVVEIAREISVSGDKVLLSPACASLDMFRNFEHRGDVFIELINNKSAFL